MKTIAVTGGVGTGKSTAVRVLKEFYGAAVVVFDCDAEVHDLLTKAEIVETIADRFGREVLDAQGAVDRSALAQRVFGNTRDRKFLESLLHPLVLEEGTACLREARESEEPIQLFIFEVPLLYEVEFAVPRDFDVLIAASPETQRARLHDGRGMSEEEIEDVLGAQMPISDKVARAERVIWNDGSVEELSAQLILITQIIEATKAQ